MRSFVVGLVALLAACSDNTPDQFRVAGCDPSWDGAFNGQHPQYCEKACQKFITLQPPGCDAKTSRSADASCAATFAFDDDGKLAQPLMGCCIKGSDTSDDPAEQFAVCN
jgi:hypothetical protein